MSDGKVVHGELSDCLIENDAEAMQRGRRLRRQALAVSLVLEALVLAAMLAWPLLYPSTLNATYIMTPVPPYRRGAEEKPRAAPRPEVRHPVPRPPLMQPPVIPHHLDTRPEPAPVVDASAESSSDSVAIGNVLGLDGGIGDGKSANPLPPPRPTVRQDAKPRQMSEGVMEAMLIRRVQPVYPVVGLSARISGTVQLRAIIGADGTVQQLTVLSGSPILARAALDAVSQWRYRPTLLNGQPIAVETLVTVKFVLE